MRRVDRVAPRTDQLPWAALLVAPLVALLVAPTAFPQCVAAQDAATVPAFERDFPSVIRPLLERYCQDCHAGDVTEAEIDLGAFETLADVRGQVPVWLKVRHMLDSGQMPPREATQPGDAERARLRQWVRAFLAAEARAAAGDPGPVVLQRLDNAEYTHTVRDLTGVASLDPAREFPVDGAAGEGFTNAGSGQGMSPALVQKYLDAAKHIADHAVLLPDGVGFSPHATRRDQTDELLGRIQAFYRRFTADGGGMAVDLQGIRFDTNQGGRLPVAEYLAATLAERDALAGGRQTIDAVARERSLNPRYLATLWKVLTEDAPPDAPQDAAENADESSPLIDAVREAWRRAKVEDAAALAAEVERAQQALWKFNTTGQIGRQGGPKRWMEPVPAAKALEQLRSSLSEAPGDNAKQPVRIFRQCLKTGLGAEHGPAERQIEAALREFRDLFPPALCYARIVPVDEVVTLRLYYREDDHLKRLMLDERQAAELDRLWDELFYVSREPLKLQVVFEQLSEFATQDRPDLVKAFEPLRKPIADRADGFRRRLVETEPAHLDAVLEFAGRAWRRPLTDTERQDLRALYRRLRDETIPHEDAIRLVLARVLTSPAFLYKLEQPPPGPKPAPVSDHELATRLSYFLWSSLPDDKLRAAADAGRLTAAVAEDTGGDTGGGSELLRQARRMLRDGRTRRLAVQFACQWLHVRGFERNDDKNEALYPEFAELRGAMSEETVRFFEAMFREDGSILDMLDADHTYLNEALARHYGIDGVRGDHWRRVDGVRGRGRGGVLGMATVLASQSGASRTSPILRGNWVYETLLGERLPRPPADVPTLPDERPEGLTERELIERHSSVPACAKCHVKIDPYGFALEQYDAIGRLRPGRADTQATLPDGRTIEGIDGLRDYLTGVRRDDVVRQFCRKLLGYALGREVQLSDEPLLEDMQAALASHGYRFSAAVETVVASPQFRMIRGRQVAE